MVIVIQLGGNGIGIAGFVLAFKKEHATHQLSLDAQTPQHVTGNTL